MPNPDDVKETPATFQPFIINRRNHISIYNSLAKRDINPVLESLGKHNSDWESIASLHDGYETNPEQATISFQINLGFRSTTKMPKPVDADGKNAEAMFINCKQWGSYRKEDGNPKDETYAGILWHTVTAPLSFFAECVAEGYPIRPGIKEGGNKQSIDYIGNHLVGFDVDMDSTVTWQQVKDCCDFHNIKVFLIYFSPSGNETNNKMRLVLAFDRIETDFKRVRKLTYNLVRILPGTNTAVFDPSRFFYGSIKPIIYQDITALNNFDDLYKRLANDEVEESNENGKGNKKKTIQTSVTVPINIDSNSFFEYIHAKIIKPIYNEKWIELLESWLNHFELTSDYIRDSSEGEGEESFRRTDPFLGSTTGVGDSFAVTLMPDKSLVFSANKAGLDGDFIDLWHYFDSQTWAVPKPNAQQRRRAIEGICKFHEVGDFFADVEFNTQKLSQVFFPNWKASFITEPHNFIPTFGFEIEDLLYVSDHSREGGQYYLWQEDEHGVYVWKKHGKLALMNDLWNMFKSEDCALEDDKDEGNTKYPMVSQGRVDEALSTIRAAVEGTLDTPEDAIAFKNCVLFLNPDDTHKPAMRPHAREYRFQEYSPIIYDPKSNYKNNPYLELMLDSINNPQHREVMLYTLAVALNPKQYKQKFGYVRAVFFLNQYGRSGKDVWKTAFTLILGSNKVHSTNLDDYADNQNLNRIGFTYKAKCLWASESSKLGNRTTALDNMPSLKSDITNNPRSFKILYKDAENKQTCYASIIMNLNSNTKIDTDKGAIADRFAYVRADLYYAEESNYDPTQPHHRKRIDEFVTEEFLLQNVTTDFLNLLLEYYDRIWNQGWKCDYGYMKNEIKKNLNDNKHIHRFANDIGLRVSSKTENALPKKYLMMLYHAWCIKEELATGEIRRKPTIPERPGTPINPDDIEDWSIVWSVVNFEHKKDKDDSDPIATSDKHFQNKLDQTFNGQFTTDREERKSGNITKRGRALVFGLELPWQLGYWE